MKVDKIKGEKQRFYKDLQKVVSNKKNNSNSYMTKTKYKLILKQVKKLKEKVSSKVAKNDKILKRFDIITEKSLERLIYPSKKKNDVVYYVTRNELFDILHEAHINTNHGGKTNMMNYLNRKYKNVTCEAVTVYLKYCTDCESKKSQPKVKLKKFKPEPKQPAQLRVPDPNTLGSIDFINMEELPDVDYRFILVYRDLRTRFIQLKPLHNLLPCDVKVALLEIFATFPAPCKIQSSHIFVSQAVEDMKKSWKGPEIIYEPVQLSNTYQDVWNIIVTWLNRSNTTKWSEGLKFVQYMKNITYDEEVQKSPFEAMFGRKGKLDINNLNLPQELINGIRPEEEEDEASNDIEINELLEVVIDDELADQKD